MLPQLYHAHHSRSQEDLPYWLGLARQVQGTVLELGCGTGRVLLPIAQAGFQVVGLDIEQDMLCFLQQHIPSQQTPQPLLVVGDMSRFHFSILFPLILLPCNTYSTLNEARRKACLACVRTHLEQGGVFAFSIPNPELLQNLPAHSKAELEDELTLPWSGDPVQVSSSWRRTKGTFSLTWIYDHLLPDGTVERSAVETVHHLVPVQTYLQELEQAGLRITGQYGDYDGSAYRSESPQLIIQATRSSD